MTDYSNLEWFSLFGSILLFYSFFITKSKDVPGIIVLMFGVRLAPYAYRGILLFYAVSLFLIFAIQAENGFIKIVSLMVIIGITLIILGLPLLYFSFFPNSKKAITLSDELQFLFFRYRSKTHTRLITFIFGLLSIFVGLIFVVGSIGGYLGY